MSRSSIALVVAGVVILVGCGSDTGPNDPGMTSAQIDKIRAAKVKPSDGVGPGGGAIAKKPK